MSVKWSSSGMLVGVLLASLPAQLACQDKAFDELYARADAVPTSDQEARKLAFAAAFRAFETIPEKTPGYEAALHQELETITRIIPARDLAIQWDCTSELQDAHGRIADLPADGLIGRNMKHFRRLGPRIPDGAELGYHLCYGTLGGWPRWQPENLSGAVTMANAFAAHSGRRVDWIHIPVLDRSDDGYFAPRKIAGALQTTSEEIARTAGLGKDAVQRRDRVRSDRTQRRLRQMVEVLNKAEPRFGSALIAYAWYRSEPLAGLGGLTAMELVRQGNAAEVMEYVDAVEAGLHS